MRRVRPGHPVPLIAVTSLLLLLVPAWSHPARAASRRTAEQVLVFTMPAVRWSDVVEHRPPTLLRFLRSAAVGSMNVRTVGPSSNLGEAYTTISAGNSATADELVAGRAFGVGEPVGSDDAATVLRTRCECDLGGAEVVHLGAAQIGEANGRESFGAVPGSLATVLGRHGHTMAAVGNAGGRQWEGAGPHREVAIAAMDRAGRVDVGTVGPELLVDTAGAPFGVRTDVGTASAAFRRAWGEADVVVLEASDLERVDRAAFGAEAENDTPWVVRARGQALAAADALLELALQEVDLTRDLVILLAPTEPRIHPGELGIGAVAGAGVEPGTATSGTTRREGFLTLTAVAPTVLRALGLPVPTSMHGGSIGSAGGGPPTIDDLEQLVEVNDASVFKNRATRPATNLFVTIQVAVALLGVVLLHRASGGARRVAGVLALISLAVPTVAFLSGLVPVRHLGTYGYVVVLYALAGVLAAGALAVGGVVALRSRSGSGGARTLAAIGLAAAVYVVLTLDLLTGASLQLNTVFSYGPIVGGRFAGYGNLAFSLVTATAIVVGSFLWRISCRALAARGTAGRRAAVLALLPPGALFGATVLTIGLPRLGSDVGGVLASVPAFIVTGLLLAGASVGWRRFLVIGAATALVIGALAFLDHARPADDRTHLGNFVALVVDQGWDGLSTVLTRKARANVGILTSAWAFIVPAAGWFLVGLRRRPHLLVDVERRVPGTRAALAGGVVAAVVGGLLNDSGIAVSAMVLAVLTPYLVLLTSSAPEGTAAPAAVRAAEPAVPPP